MRLGYVIIFLFGLVLGFGISFFGNGVITGFVVSDFEAPSNWISEDDIIVFNDRIVLFVENASLSSYSGSGSMRPFFDEGANGVRVVPLDSSEIEVGDIVSFRVGDRLVVHRVVEKGVDSEGVYFVVQGDNNLIGDGKVRFEEIEWVTVAVVF